MRSIRDPATDELRDSISRDWTNYLAELPVTPLPIANDLDAPETIMSSVSADALLLTNGEDLGEHPPRDQTERTLVDAALADGVPVLGVCRGHQFLNQYFGGQVVMLADHFGTKNTHAGTTHDIRVRDGFDTLPDRIEVNSYHDMGVVRDGIAPELNPFAVSKDGVIEGLYHPNHELLSIQWHPERPLPAQTPTNNLILQFLEGTLS
jgi:putative glutamine amidotransferase